MNDISKVYAEIGAEKVYGYLLAGGIGQRLGLITDADNRWAIAKPAAPVGSYHIIDYAIRPLVDMGISDFHVGVLHLDQTIRDILTTTRYPRINFKFYMADRNRTLDTAGNVRRAMLESGITNGTVIVRSGDIASNIEPQMPLSQHLMRDGLGATIVVNPVPFEGIDQFGTVGLEGMPTRTQNRGAITMGRGYSSGQAEFEQSLGRYYLEYEGQSRNIVGFKEKAARELALSNLQNSSDYYISVEMLLELGQAFTFRRVDGVQVQNPYCDWGGHVFPSLTAREIDDLSRFPSLLKAADGSLASKILEGGYFFQGFIMPDQTSYRVPSFWADLGRPYDLFKANMSVIEGRLSNESLPENIIHHRVLPNGATIIDSIIPEDEEIIIGSNAFIQNSVLRQGTVIGHDVKMVKSIMFPQHNGETINVSPESVVYRTMVTGGRIENHLIPENMNEILVVGENSTSGKPTIDKYRP